jgi:peptidyl-prolyl cis-trans isomerase B (cyclophilin B)
MKRILFFLAVFLLTINLFGCKKEGIQVTIEMEKGGEIVIQLFGKDAPKTVENFIKLTDKKFYDGLIFHRVVPGFVVQGGDPRGNGTGGPGHTIKLETSGRKHITGAVAMARKKDIDSAGSQFYICLAPQPSLDGKYAVFGQVTSGMDVVEKIERGDVMKRVYVSSQLDKDK